MATKTAPKTSTRKAAPTPVAAASTAASTQKGKGTKAAQTAAPQAPLYVVGKLPPVRGGTHRAYAQAVITAMAKANKKGFTLAQYRAALVAGAAASSIAPPRHGWAKHNMPTWVVGQAWLVLAK